MSTILIFNKKVPGFNNIIYGFSKFFGSKKVFETIFGNSEHP